MSVTLEVSKLSGWLNVDAPCQVPKRGRAHAVRGEVWPGWREDGGRPLGDRGASSVQGRARLQVGGRARGGAHIPAEHPVHVCDAGGVEAQRLVEPIHELPRVERRAYDAGRGSGQEAGGGGRPRCKQRAGEGSTAGLGARQGEERT